MFASLGWGAELRVQYPGKYKHVVLAQNDQKDMHAKSIMYNIMYLPFSLGCEYVFDSGFAIGAEMHFRVIFYQDDHWYYKDKTETDNNGSPVTVRDIYGVDYVPHAILGEYTIGVHMGYKF